MKKPSLRRFAKFVPVGFLGFMLLSFSCGKTPSENLEETGSTVDVTGAFVDWTPGTSSFAGGRFILLDAATNEVFTSNEITPTKPNFQIDDVPITGKYYGILIDNRFEPRAYIENKLIDGKRQRVFKLSSTSGRIGTIVVRDQTIEPSQHAELEFQANLGVMNVNKAFEKEFNVDLPGNPDIDEDGTPNVIDTNVDGDETPNIFDAYTYKTGAVQDSAISWQYNIAYGIPKLGFFKCNYLRAPKAPTDLPAKFKLNFSCMLRLPAGVAESVELTTVKTFLENTEPREANNPNQIMKDDGTGGDLIASDGVWTSRFSIAENTSDVFRGQLIFANVKLNTGAKKTFVTTLEPKTHLTLAHVLEPVCASDKKLFEFGLRKEAFSSIKADISNFMLSLTLKTHDGEEVSATPELLRTTKDSNEKYKFDVDDNTMKIQDGTYYMLLKITAPSSLPGVLGSAYQFYLPVKLNYNAAQEQKMQLECAI